MEEKQRNEEKKKIRQVIQRLLRIINNHYFKIELASIAWKIFVSRERDISDETLFLNRLDRASKLL